MGQNVSFSFALFSGETDLNLFFNVHMGEHLGVLQQGDLSLGKVQVFSIKLCRLKLQVHASHGFAGCMEMHIALPRFAIYVFPEMAYTKFMTTCMLHFLESYPESCPRIIPANHTTTHTHDFEAMF